ncbi:MAG: hypothetical protein GXP19_01660 [Gammaproteobacteria bacterium]|nr:hypothetical protein [Gammaproteobacteria bacterium]
MKRFTELVFLAGSIGFANLAVAANTELSGFADIVYVVSDGVNDPPFVTENRFDVSAELDLKTSINDAMSTRIDIDLNTNSGALGGGDSARLEQAFFSWDSDSAIKIKAGVFNNPLGWEAEDAPDLYQISHGQIYEIWDRETDFSGNNVAGVEVSATIGAMQIMGALLNDLGNVVEEQSLMGLARYSPERMPDLALEAGFVTQDQGLETIIDVNATLVMSALTVGAEILLPAENIDFAIGGTGSYKISDQLSVTGRVDHVSYDDPSAPTVDDVFSITLAASYMLDKNLVANVELRINDSDLTNTNSFAFGGCSAVTCDGEVIQVEAIATF